MCTMTPSTRSRVVLTIGILGALVTIAGTAQELKQDRLRAQGRILLQGSLPELVLLPEPVPFPLMVPPPVTTQSVQPQDPVTAPPPAQPADQAVSVDPMVALQQERQARPVRLSQTPPPSEQNGPPQETKFAELATVVPTDPPPLLLLGPADFPAPDTTIAPRDHPAMGSYYGKAIQVCAAGVAPSACANGQPASALLMTPTLTGDGLFVADDSFTLLPPPYGPHATAHGTWTPTSATEFTAEYVFLTRTFPPLEGTMSGVRARWVAKAVDANTLVGWVNAYFLGPVPVNWTPLAEDEYPAFPVQGLPFVTAPVGFIKDPGQCLGAGCPQVFKFTLKRITR